MLALGITDHEATQAELETGAALKAPHFNTAAIAYVLAPASRRATPSRSRWSTTRRCSKTRRRLLRTRRGFCCRLESAACLPGLARRHLSGQADDHPRRQDADRAELKADRVRVEWAPSPTRTPRGTALRLAHPTAKPRGGGCARRSRRCRCSAFSSVRPISSRPSIRQRLRNGSMSKWITPPSGPLICWFSRSTVMVALPPREASSSSLSISLCGRSIGRMPFLKQLL